MVSPAAAATAPRVAVGMPVYNSGKYLVQSIESVLAQSFTDFELIISDNASTDGSWAICESFAARDRRIRLFRNPVNLGGNPNYRKVAEVARGEYFKWASSNDLIAPNYLERCVATLDARPDAVLAYGSTILFEEDPERGSPYEDRMDLQHSDPVERFRNAFARMRLNNALNGLMRISALRHSSFLPDYMASDNVLVAELALVGKLVEVRDTYFYRRMSPQSATRLQSEEEIRRHHYPTNRLTRFFQVSQFAAGCVRTLAHPGLPPGVRLRASAHVVRLLYWLLPGLAADVGEALRFYVLRRRLAAEPRVLTLTADGDDYTTCFHAALGRAGIEVLKAEWSGRWLHHNVRSGDVIALHWPSFLYYDPGSRRRTWMNMPRYAVLLLALRVRGAKIAWTAHNLYPHDGGRAERAHRVGRWVVARLASMIGVHGKSAVEIVRREFKVPASRILLLEHGNWIGFYENNVTRAEARARLQIPQQAFLFLFIGLCKPYKNLEELLRAHASVHDDSLLWIAGRFQSAAYHTRVLEVARSAAPERVTIRNEFVTSADIQLYLNACDTVVLPYREILTSGAAMLAFSFGRPVVAPALGTLRELVTDDTGILYDPHSATGLADALRAARGRSFSAQRIIERARQFSWDRSAAAFARRIAELR